MQSGITASAELQDAFQNFTTDNSVFALPITISKESLSPLPPVPVSSTFESSLSSLQEHVSPKTPIYLLVRTPQSDLLTAITYVPSTAPVRSKMLFASTRATLTRDLGLEKFGDSVFATDAHEILDPQQWQARAHSSSSAKANGADNVNLTREERELQSVKRAEEEERHGTSGRDLMGAGGSGSRLAMKITDEAKAALTELGRDGAVVILDIEMSSETLRLVSSEISPDPARFLEGIPVSQPSYAFYKYPDVEETVFVYTCPGTSKVKERMTYASAKSGVLTVAMEQGVRVTRRLEASERGEIGVERLREEVGLKTDNGQSAASRGFARPKRPGRK